MRATTRNAGDHTLLRELNRGVVLDMVKREGPMSRADIAKRTELAKPTVSAIIQQLVDEDVVRELGIGEASRTGGRRPILFEFNPRSQYLIGVDVGVEATTVVLADAIGQELARVRGATPHRNASAALALANDMARQVMAAERVDPGAVAAAGVCVPGLVDPATGCCRLAPNLGWRDVDVLAALTALSPAPVHVHNVTQGVLVAEYLEGAAKDAEDVVLLYEDNGVGAAVLVDGRVLRGARGIAGEIGHCKPGRGKEPCNCGDVGCLETLVSAPAMLRRAGGLVPDGLSGRQGVRALAASADRRAPKLLRDVGRELGQAVSWMVNLFDPEVVVVAGGFVDAGPMLFDGLLTGLADGVLPESAGRADIRLSGLGEDASIRGTVLLALQAAERGAANLF